MVSVKMAFEMRRSIHRSEGSCISKEKEGWWRRKASEEGEFKKRRGKRVFEAQSKLSIPCSMLSVLAYSNIILYYPSFA